MEALALQMGKGKKDYYDMCQDNAGLREKLSAMFDDEVKSLDRLKSFHKTIKDD